MGEPSGWKHMSLEWKLGTFMYCQLSTEIRYAVLHHIYNYLELPDMKCVYVQDSKCPAIVLTATLQSDDKVG